MRRRIGPVDSEGLTSEAACSQVDALGVGWYQVLVLAGVGSAAIAECVEMGAAAPMHTALARAFSLSPQVRAALPAITVAGSAVGMLVAGPLCDRWGRKSALLWSNAGICVAMLGTAFLPEGSEPRRLLALRFLAGAAGSLGVPAGTVLAVESSPRRLRARLMFAIAFLSSVGYLLSAVGLHLFMPYLGEGEKDEWRSFYLFVALPSIIGLPFVAMLCESPCFLAVNGQPDEAAEVLCHMARWNGVPLARSEVRLPEPVAAPGRGMFDVVGKVWSVMWLHGVLAALLITVDGCRGYFVAGSSYIWKDFFALAAQEREVTASPAMLNMMAEIAPLVGLIIGERFVWLGIRKVTFICSMLAAAWLVLLTTEARECVWLLVGMIMAVKFTYGPISTCVALMKTEAFPTEIRVTAFAFVSVLSKVATAAAPTLIEAMKGGDGKAASWDDVQLEHFVLSLAGAVTLCGTLALAIPRHEGEDYLRRSSSGDATGLAKCSQSSFATRSSYGSFHSSFHSNGSGKSIGNVFDVWDEGRQGLIFNEDAQVGRFWLGSQHVHGSLSDSDSIGAAAHEQAEKAAVARSEISEPLDEIHDF